MTQKVKEVESYRSGITMENLLEAGLSPQEAHVVKMPCSRHTKESGRAAFLLLDKYHDWLAQENTRYAEERKATADEAQRSSEGLTDTKIQDAESSEQKETI